MSLFGKVMATSALFTCCVMPVQAKRAMSAVAIGDPADWFSSDDYPPDALRAEREGRAVAAVGVDSAGRVVSCVIDVSSGTTSLDLKTCELAMAKGLFNPATNRKGEPIASVYLLPVRWVIPEPDVPVPLAVTTNPGDETAEYELTVGADGKLVSCRVTVANAELGDGCQGFAIGSTITSGWRRADRPVGAKMVWRYTRHVVVDP